MKLTTYALFVCVYLVRHSASHPGLIIHFQEEDDESSHKAFANGDSSAKENNTTQNQAPDIHNLSVLEYLEKFNASELPDQNEVNRYLAIQRHMEDHDGSESVLKGRNAVSNKDSAENKELNLQIRNQLEKEFLKHHQHSKGQWDILAKCTPDQRIELCKEVYRRTRGNRKEVFQVRQQFKEMKVLVEGSRALITDLLKCTISTSVLKWNGIAISGERVFYLSEGSSPYEVFKLSALNDDQVQIEGKIVEIKYPQTYT